MKIPKAFLASFVTLSFLFQEVSAQNNSQQTQAEEIAQELANPLAPVTTLSLNYRFEGGNGPDNDVNYQFRLQPSFFKPLSGESALLLRTIIPAYFKEWPIDENGLGDITLAPYYIPNITRKTILGFGGALGFPTATEDTLGAEKFTGGPAVIIAKTGMPITYGGLAQHIWSYAGDPNRGDISVSTIQPFFSYVLGNGWSSTLSMEASYNWVSDDDCWTLPLALGVSKVAQIGKQYVNFGLAGVDYLDGPTGAPEWEIRLSATLVIK